MASKESQPPSDTTKLKNNIVNLFENEKARTLFVGIRLATGENSDLDSSIPREGSVPNQDVDEIKVYTISEKMSCHYCNAEFKERKEQKHHYKGDWHRYNLKQSLRGVEAVSEEIFMQKAEDSDISSISGSESESESSDSDENDTKDSSNQKNTINTSKPRISKVSDTESDSEMSAHVEGIGRRHPRVFLRNSDGEMFSIYRCIIHSKKNQPETPIELLDIIKELPQKSKWVILMMAGGHFAAALFEGKTVIEHKTFHRYVVRAKRGTAQSARDAQGNAPKSGGASLRRYNEAALAQDISNLINSWSNQMRDCDRIFLRVPTHNKSVFYNGKTPLLDKKDSRIRLIPFPTRRPTFKEVQRVHEGLSSIECYGTESHITDHIKVSPVKKNIMKDTQSKKGKTGSPRLKKAQRKPETDSDTDSASEGEYDLSAMTVTLTTLDLKPFEITKKPRRRKKKEKVPQTQQQNKTSVETPVYDEETYQVRNDLYTACKTGEESKVREMVEKIGKLEINGDKSSENKDDVTLHEGNDSEKQNTDHKEKKSLDILNDPFGNSFSTLLHLVAKAGHKSIIRILLVEGADPAIMDKNGDVPYIVATDKPTRNEFRKFMAEFPEKYDYIQAKVPGPLTDEMENEKKAKEAERKKAQKKAKRERMKEQKEEEAKQRTEEKEKHRYVTLSDREKRALAAERRLTTQFTAAGQTAPVLSRCWNCGSDMTGKVPFEYFDFKFCTPKCLKEHKMNKSKT